MAQKPVPPDRLAREAQLAAQALREHGSVAEAARALGWSWSTFKRRLEEAQAQPPYDFAQAEAPLPRRPFEAPALPTGQVDLETLLAQRRQQFQHKMDAHAARRLIPVRVNVDGPFGIGHMGDPHVDDDGCDIPTIERHIRIFKANPHLFPATVGDVANNWIGRLARLWAEQSTSQAQAAALVEWFLTSLDWLYIIWGNHDDWGGFSAAMARMLGGAQPVIAESAGARLDLRTPNGRSFRVNARHDFKGHSQWNTAHGPAKAAQMGWRDHILTCGHLHTSGYQVLKCPATGLISHAIRVASYKTIDRYAVELGLPDQNIFVCPVTIIDPAFADDDPRCVTVLFDPEEGSEYLLWKRRKWEQNRRHG